MVQSNEPCISIAKHDKKFQKKKQYNLGASKNELQKIPPKKKTELPTCWGVDLSGHHESSDSSDASETSKCLP